MFAESTNVALSFVSIATLTGLCFYLALSDIDKRVMLGRRAIIEAIWSSTINCAGLVILPAFYLLPSMNFVLAAIAGLFISTSPAVYVLLSGKWRGLILTAKVPQMHGVALYSIQRTNQHGEYLITTTDLNTAMDVLKVPTQERTTMHRILHKYFKSIGYIVSWNNNTRLDLTGGACEAKVVNDYTYCVDRKHIATNPPHRLQEYSGW